MFKVITTLVGVVCFVVVVKVAADRRVAGMRQHAQELRLQIEATNAKTANMKLSRYIILLVAREDLRRLLRNSEAMTEGEKNLATAAARNMTELDTAMEGIIDAADEDHKLQEIQTASAEVEEISKQLQRLRHAIKSRGDSGLSPEVMEARYAK